MYARINGHGCPAIPKPQMHRKILSQEQEEQFEIFLSDKDNVNMSSYKVDSKSGLPLLYLSKQKEILWENFHKMYPNGMGRTAFLDRLRNGPFVYKEDLGGLCSICSQYGYDVIHDVINLVIKGVESTEKQVRHLKENIIIKYI